MNDTPITPIRSSWSAHRFIMRGPLTDRKIAEYERRGYYSPEFREARRQHWAAKEARRLKREGNFLEMDGRLIYSPL